MQHTIIRAMLYYILTHKMAAELCTLQYNKEYIHLPASISSVTYLEKKNGTSNLDSGIYVSIGQNNGSSVFKINGKVSSSPLTGPIIFQFKNETHTNNLLLKTYTISEVIKSIEMDYNVATFVSPFFLKTKIPSTFIPTSKLLSTLFEPPEVTLNAPL